MMFLIIQKSKWLPSRRRSFLKVSKGFRLFIKFAAYAMGGKKCGVWTLLDIWSNFILVRKASDLSIGAMMEIKQWWNIWRWGRMIIKNITVTNNQKLGPLSSMINLRTLCAPNVRNINAKEIFLNWKTSKQEANNSVGYVLLV